MNTMEQNLTSDMLKTNIWYGKIQMKEKAGILSGKTI